MVMPGDQEDRPRRQLDEETMENLLTEARRRAGLPPSPAHPSDYGVSRDGRGDIGRKPDSRKRSRSGGFFGQCPTWVVAIILLLAIGRAVYIASSLTPAAIRERIRKEKERNSPDRPIMGPRGMMYPVRSSTPATSTADPAAEGGPSEAAMTSPSPTIATPQTSRSESASTVASAAAEGGELPHADPAPSRALGPGWSAGALQSDEETVTANTPAAGVPAAATPSAAEPTSEAKAKGAAPPWARLHKGVGATLRRVRQGLGRALGGAPTSERYANAERVAALEQMLAQRDRQIERLQGKHDAASHGGRDEL